MSLFANPRGIRPGPIDCNPLDGLCHRVAVVAKRILDSAIREETLENTPLPLADPRMPPPVRFISACSAQTAAVISNLEITRIRERRSFARVSYDVTIPVQVEYECAEGNCHRAQSCITSCDDIIMFVPGESVFPFEVTASCSAQATVGRIVNGEVCATMCCTTVTRVVTDSDILLPTYGHIRPGHAVTARENACRDFFDLPLYPTGRN